MAAFTTFRVTVVAQGLSARVEPSSLTAYQGGGTPFTLRLTPSGGLSGLVALSLLEGSSPVSWASLSPSYVNLAPSGEQSFLINLNLSSTAPLGSHALTVKLVHSAGETALPLSLTVRAPTFYVSLSPASFTLRPGESASAVLSLATEGGFTGTVSLSLTGAPGFSLAPSSVDTSAWNWGLLLRNDSASAPGTYNLTLVATSGSTTRTVPITVTVPPPPDFLISLSPNALTVSAGSSGAITLTVTPQNGFTGTLSLSLVDDATGSPVPGITLSPRA